jgi:hypothetical protein
MMMTMVHPAASKQNQNRHVCILAPLEKVLVAKYFAGIDVRIHTRASHTTSHAGTKFVGSFCRRINFRVSLYTIHKSARFSWDWMWITITSSASHIGFTIFGASRRVSTHFFGGLFTPWPPCSFTLSSAKILVHHLYRWIQDTSLLPIEADQSSHLILYQDDGEG